MTSSSLAELPTITRNQSDAVEDGWYNAICINETDNNPVPNNSITQSASNQPPFPNSVPNLITFKNDLTDGFSPLEVMITLSTEKRVTVK